jgi:hypothetical protein
MRSDQMRLHLLSLVVAVAALAPARAADPAVSDPAKKKAELKWARGVADDFLAALGTGESKAATALLTADYAKAIAGKGSAADYLARWFNPAEKSTITGEDISPDDDEVQLKGTLESSNGDGTVTWRSAFVLRVVKEKDSGRWRVGFVLVEASKAKLGAPKK